MILKRDAFSILDRFEDCEGTAIYADPPYHAESRSKGAIQNGRGGKYLHEFDHNGGTPTWPSSCGKRSPTHLRRVSSTLGGYRLGIERHKAYSSVCIIVQGTEGEIVKEAMTRVDAKLGTNDDFYMTLQVHDELIFDASTKTKKDHLPILRMIKGEMEAAGAVSTVKVVANCEVNPINWADCQKVTL